MSTLVASAEKTLKEHPSSTRWIQDGAVVGAGNLILTNRRLIFLNRVELSEQQVENIRRMSEHSTSDRIADFALTLHEKNFQIPLTSIISVGIGVHAILPLPRPCLRVTYRNKRNEVRTESFMFSIPLLKGFFEFEITDVLVWVIKIKGAIKKANRAAAF